MNKEKTYTTPWAVVVHCSPLLLVRASHRPTGYAIDNDDADDDLIIPIKEQDDDDEWDDEFLDID